MRLYESAPSIVDAALLPRLVRLAPKFHGAVFDLMKLLPARFILERARDEGAIEPGSVVIETTSGTFGLALAMLCNLHGYRLILVSDPAVEPPLKRRLEDLGARVKIVTEPAPVGGFQRARLDRMAELQAQHPGNFCPSQYSNPHNPGAYAPFAELLTESLGQIDALVGPVGSGGSMCGTTNFLRLLFPEMKAIGVDTHGSVLFGLPDGKRLLRGLGNSLMPSNLTHSAFDEVHWVSAAEGFAATRALHRQHSLYMGPTSGAAYMVAKWWADAHPDAKVVALFPDGGYRYEGTVYDDAWLRANDVACSALPTRPQFIDHPHEVDSVWAAIDWNKRTYDQILGRQFKAQST